jgi:hypothetical protein
LDRKAKLVIAGDRGKQGVAIIEAALRRLSVRGIDGRSGFHSGATRCHIVEPILLRRRIFFRNREMRSALRE